MKSLLFSTMNEWTHKDLLKSNHVHVQYVEVLTMGKNEIKQHIHVDYAHLKILCTGHHNIKTVGNPSYTINIEEMS